MTPRELLAVLRERWRSVVAGLLLGLVVAATATFLVPRQYASETSIIVTGHLTNPTSTALEATDISAQRMRTYVELLKSRKLSREVQTELALPMTPEQVAGKISVSNPPDTTILLVTVTDGDPARAIAIATVLGGKFRQEIARIEQPPDPAVPPLVVAAVYEDPSPPAVTSPRPVLYLGLGAALGLVAGVAAALLRRSLDSSVRGRREIEDALGAPVRGVLPRERAMARRPLTILDRPHTPTAEAVRQLRTNLGFLGADRAHPGRDPASDGSSGPAVLLVTSACPGEGRTTTVCHLGLALVAAGYRVLLVDGDLRRSTLAKRLGIETRVGLVGVLAEHRPVEAAIRTWEPGLDVLPGGTEPGDPSELLGSPHASEVFARIRASYDVVLVDAPALLPVADAAVLVPRVDGVLLVIRYGRTTAQQVEEARALLDGVSARIVGGVLTMARATPTGRYTTRRAPNRVSSAAAQPAGADAPEPAIPSPATATGTSEASSASTNGTRRPSPRPHPPGKPRPTSMRPGENPS